MKKIAILILFGALVPVSAQTVSSVSYNPSRLGQYSRLKVADKILFLGGLITPTLDIVANQKVTFGWASNNPGGVYKMDKLWSSILGGTVEVRQAVVAGASDSFSVNPYVASSSSFPTVGNNFIVTLVGGTGRFLEDSFVSTDLDTVNMRAYAANVNTNTIKVAGSGSGSLINENHANTTTTRGLFLVGGDIPSDGTAASELKWCKRIACKANACDNSSNKQTVYLLGYNCETSL